MRPAQVQDAGGRRQSGHELAPAHVHGKQYVVDGHLAPELLRVRQRLGHAVARQLAIRQLLRVLGPSGRIRLAVQHHVVGHAHGLLGGQEAEGHRRDEPVEDAVGAALPLRGRHRHILAPTRSAPVRSPEGVG